MTRLIGLDMNNHDMFRAISGNDHRSFEAISKLSYATDFVDPDKTFGGFWTIVEFDTYEIYDEKPWRLYNDVCGKDVIKALACLRAIEFNIISENALHQAIDGEIELDLDEIVLQVKERLPNFGKAAIADATEEVSEEADAQKQLRQLNL